MRALLRWRRFAMLVGTPALALAIVAVMVLVPALDALRSQRAEIDSMVFRLARERAALARHAALTEAMRAKLADAAGRFIQGDGASAMNADLLTRLRLIAEERGVNYTSFAPLPSRDWSGRKLIGARVEFSGLSRTVSTILADIEAGTTFMFIDKAHLTAAKIDGADETVSVSLDVYGAAG